MMPADSQHTFLYVLAAAAGFLTWSILHRHGIPGDAALLSYVCGYAALYIALRLYPSLAGHALWTSVVLMATYTATAVLSTVAYRLSPWHPLAKFPGPRLSRVSSLWLTYISFKGRRHLVIDRMHAQYGRFIRIGPNTLSINSLAAGYIYSGTARMPKSDSYRAPGHNEAVALFFKQPTEKLHSDRKRVWAGLFAKEGLYHVLTFLERRTFELLECIERRQVESKDGTVDLAECFYHWSYDLMGDFVFGGYNRLELMQKGDPHEMVEGGKLAIRILDSVGQTPWLFDIIWWLPSGTAMNRLSDTAAKLLKTRLAVTEPPLARDLVSFLTEDEKIPQKDLDLEAMVAIQGGSDNTSVNLTLAMYFMMAEPKYFALLRRELEQVFPDPSGPLPDEKLAQMPLLDAVLKESLRLGSPYFMPREVPAGGATIDGQFVPEGTVVAQAAYSQQIDPDNFYPEPLRFLPERWLPEGLGPSTRTNKSALLSFSWGPHACVGKLFAYQEMRHTLSRLVLNMDVNLVDNFDTKSFRDGILNIRTTILENSLMVRAKRRGECSV